MAGKNAEVAQQVHPRRGTEATKRAKKSCGSSTERARAVSPDFLQLELEASVGPTRQALLSKWGTGDVPAEPLDLGAVATVDALLGVYVDPPDLGDRLVVVGRGSWSRVPGNDKAQRWLSCAFTRDRDALSRSRVVGGERELVDWRRARLASLSAQVEASAAAA